MSEVEVVNSLCRGSGAREIALRGRNHNLNLNQAAYQDRGFTVRAAPAGGRNTYKLYYPLVVQVSVRESAEWRERVKTVSTLGPAGASGGT